MNKLGILHLRAELALIVHPTAYTLSKFPVVVYQCNPSIQVGSVFTN